MKRAELEALGLEKETVDRIMAINGMDIENAKSGKDQQISTLEAMIKERDSQLEQLKSAASATEAMKEEIETLKGENERAAKEYKAQLKQFKVDAAVESALNAAGSRNNIAVKALLTEVLKNASFDDDGKIKGLDEAITELKGGENSSFLFTPDPDPVPAEPAPAPEPHFSGFQPGGGEPNGGAGQPDFSQMTYSQMMAYQTTHPDVKFS